MIRMTKQTDYGFVLLSHLATMPEGGANAPELATAVVEEAARQGLLLLKAGLHGNCIRVLCPLVITDATNLEASIPVPCLTPTTRTYTFTQPGKYLVICGFLPHFQVGMYGWVEVKE